MLLLKYLLLFTGAVLAGGALAILIQDIYRARRLWQLDSPDAEAVQPPVEIRWRGAGRLAVMSILPFLLGTSFVVVPSGHAGVLVSQISGTLPGALYPAFIGLCL